MVKSWKFKNEMFNNFDINFNISKISILVYSLDWIRTGVLNINMTRIYTS